MLKDGSALNKITVATHIITIKICCRYIFPFYQLYLKLLKLFYDMQNFLFFF